MGCRFRDARAGSRPSNSHSSTHRTLPRRHQLATECPTRIRPPRDVVKLEDRLRFLLQPPLESLLAAESLRFAHRPFPYQLDGIAFLYPRHQAVLADEMGLGKTMQAITAVRLLAHHGHVRRVLLVCPKPLVTNWQREFALWAPELPVTVDRRRRRPSAMVVASFAGRGDASPTTNRSSAIGRRLRPAESLRPGDSRRVAADQESREHHQPSRAIDSPRAAVGPSRARRSKTASKTWSASSSLSRPGTSTAEMKPRAIGRAVSDYVLRRTKEQVLTDLPPKLFRDAELELTPEQAASYQLAEDEGVIRLREMKHEVTIQHVFELVLRLKQICNFDPATGESSKIRAARSRPRRSAPPAAARRSSSANGWKR